jgi:acyl dehydratase
MPHLLLKPIHYDAARRRLWILGQRCHHGATGALLAAAGSAVAVKAQSPTYAALVAAGGVLMAHDWHDRAIWFKPGWQNQP